MGTTTIAHGEEFRNGKKVAPESSGPKRESECWPTPVYAVKLRGGVYIFNIITFVKLSISRIVILAILAVLGGSARAGLVFEADLTDNVFPSGEIWEQ
jgi:hypothetical protein